MKERRGPWSHWTGVTPTRDKTSGELRFEDAAEFLPNLTPSEVLELGSFGGAYFRDIKSGVTGEFYRNTWKELPEEWLKGMDVRKMVASSTYQIKVNKYKVDCGAKLDKKSDPFGLGYWEKSGWITEHDPYGWFQWYTNFYRGRRCADDSRQISRWVNCAGPKGRWRSNLIGKVLSRSGDVDDSSVSPVVRQTLQHWGYRLTAEHYKAGLRRLAGVKAKAEPSESTSSVEAEQEKEKKRSSEKASREARAELRQGKAAIKQEQREGTRKRAASEKPIPPASAKKIKAESK